MRINLATNFAQLHANKIAKTCFKQNENTEKPVPENVEENKTEVVSKETAEAVKNSAMQQVSFKGHSAEIRSQQCSVPCIKPIYEAPDFRRVIGFAESEDEKIVSTLTNAEENITGEPGAYKLRAISNVIKKSNFYHDGQIEFVRLKRYDDLDNAMVYFLDKGEQISEDKRQEYDILVHQN